MDMADCGAALLCVGCSVQGLESDKVSWAWG